MSGGGGAAKSIGRKEKEKEKGGKKGMKISFSPSSFRDHLLLPPSPFFFSGFRPLSDLSLSLGPSLFRCFEPPSRPPGPG